MTVISLGMVILVRRTADTLLDNTRGNNEAGLVGLVLESVKLPACRV